MIYPRIVPNDKQLESMSTINLERVKVELEPEIRSRKNLWYIVVLGSLLAITLAPKEYRGHVILSSGIPLLGLAANNLPKRKREEGRAYCYAEVILERRNLTRE